jgi:putative ABC transport system permease protein
MLARGASREREIAIRGALGASRFRIARQLITESLVLSTVGGAFGVGVAVASLAWLESARPVGLALLDRAQMDWRVLMVALLLTAATGIAFGLVSAARGARDATAGSLKDTAASGTTSRRQGRARSLLVVTEMALSALLLVGASLVVRSIMKLQSVDPGFDSKNLYAIDVRFPRGAYKTDEARTPFMDALAARARQLPGVSSVTAVSTMPPNVMIFVEPLEIETPSGPRVDEGSSFNPLMSVHDDFFSKAGIRFVEGATFSRYAVDRREVIINASLARRLWPGQSALGRHVRLASSDPKDREPWNTVVGVTADLMVHGLSGVGKEGLIIYPAKGSGQTLAIRATDAAVLFREMRAAARQIDASVTTLVMTSVERDVTDTIAQQRFITLLLSGFAVLAVVLSAIGLYGVLSYSVAERTREIGVRIALGATPSNLAAEVVRGGVVLSAIGLVIGLVAANWGTRLLRSVLFSIGEHDAASYVTAGVLLLGVSIIACVVPMRRAMSVDPVIAMRDGADRRW